MDRNNSDISPAMLASRSFDNILHQIQTSNLNFYLQLSPFGAHISLKKTLIKDKAGSYICPAVSSSQAHSDNLKDLLHEVAAAHATIKVLEDEMNQLKKANANQKKEIKDLKNSNKVKLEQNRKLSEASNYVKKKIVAKKKTGREDPKAVTAAQQVEHPAQKISSFETTVGTLDSNYNVEVSNIFSPLSNFQCEPKESILDPRSSPISPALPKLPPPTSCGTPPHAEPAPSSPRTPLGTPPPLLKSTKNPVIYFEGKPVSTEFACLKIKEVFKKMNASMAEEN